MLRLRPGWGGCRCRGFRWRPVKAWLRAWLPVDAEDVETRRARLPGLLAERRVEGVLPPEPDEPRSSRESKSSSCTVERRRCLSRRRLACRLSLQVVQLVAWEEMVPPLLISVPASDHDEASLE